MSAPYYGRCPHLAAALDGIVISNKSPKGSASGAPSTSLLSNWKFVQEYLHLSRLNLIDQSKVREPSCLHCNGAELGPTKLHLCLHCSKCFCFKNGHLASHFSDLPDHFLAVDIKNDHVYCLKCKSNIVHPRFDEIAVQARHFAVSQFQKLTKRPTYIRDYEEWSPSTAEKAIISTNALSGSLRGLRGLLNLGNTCFMNSVLQSLVSNPMFSNYFLAERHNRKTCDLTRSSRICLGCEADLVIEHMFSGERVPFSPHRFLLMTWRCTDHLAGYEQQDAHDFYISTMNAIHTHIGESLILEQETRVERLVEKFYAENQIQVPLPSKPIDMRMVPSEALQGVDLYNADSFSDEHCGCVTHKCFAGFLRSDVTCLSCHAVSSVKEAFLDIPIDLEGLEGANTTLIDGLNLFTNAELLESFHCENCAKRSPCTKQLSIDQLPLTLCFHLKRFKHTLTSTRKNDAYMPFPFNIDMTPYTKRPDATNNSETQTTSEPSNDGNSETNKKAKSSNNSRANGAQSGSEGKQTGQQAQNQGNGANLQTSYLSPNLDSIENGGFVPRADRAVYSLYAVVNHSGNMENGHYTGFMRKGKHWYKSDDHFITKASPKEVAASRAYLLFYCRTVLEYQD